MSNEDLKNLYYIRDGVDTDRPFLFSTFLRGVYYGDRFFKDRVPKADFMEQYHAVLEHILSLPTVSVKIAALKEDPDVILGCAITSGEGTIAHWLFVKSRWRNIGIAKSLVDSSTIKVATHMTTVGEALLKKYKSVVYNPFKIK